MALLDWGLLAVLALSMLLGAWRGLVFEVLSLAGWVLAFVVARWFAGDLRHLERKVAGRGVCAASCGGCQERRGCANRHLSEVHKRGGFIRIRKIFAISGIQKYTAPAYRTGIF